MKKIRFIAYNIKTSEFNAQTGKYSGMSSDESDIAHRVDVLLSAIKEAHRQTQSLSRADTTIFVAPEFFFRGGTGGAYELDYISGRDDFDSKTGSRSSTSIRSLNGRLDPELADSKYSNWIFVLGTVIGKMPAVPSAPSSSSSTVSLPSFYVGSGSTQAHASELEILNIALVRTGGVSVETTPELAATQSQSASSTSSRTVANPSGSSAQATTNRFRTSPASQMQAALSDSLLVYKEAISDVDFGTAKRFLSANVVLSSSYSVPAGSILASGSSFASGSTYSSGSGNATYSGTVSGVLPVAVNAASGSVLASGSAIVESSYYRDGRVPLGNSASTTSTAICTIHPTSGGKDERLYAKNQENTTRSYSIGTEAKRALSSSSYSSADIHRWSQARTYSIASSSATGLGGHSHFGMKGMNFLLEVCLDHLVNSNVRRAQSSSTPAPAADIHIVTSCGMSPNHLYARRAFFLVDGAGSQPPVLYYYDAITTTKQRRVTSSRCEERTASVSTIVLDAKATSAAWGLATADIVSASTFSVPSPGTAAATRSEAFPSGYGQLVVFDVVKLDIT